MFTNAARPAGVTAKTGEISTDAGMILCGYGLEDDDIHERTLHRETHPCIDDCTSAAMQRYEDIQTTMYEIFIPAHALGMDAFTTGFSFGFGTCINDGDAEADAGTSQNGQGGWSGWSPYGIVHGGKQVENNGLATLVGDWVKPSNLNSWTPSATGAAVCEDLRSQGGTGVGCWANGKDAVQAAGVEVDDMRWNIPSTGFITLDGDLSDWDGLAYKTQTPFRNCDKVGGAPCASPFVEFDVCVACVGSATWTGITDHSEATAFAWNSDTMWCGIKVIDDTHQNPGSGWNGDSVQIMFTNAARPQGGTAKTGEIDTPAGMILYNYGLSDDGDYTAHHETHPCPSDDDCTEMAAIRFEDDKTTIYDFVFPAARLGQDAYVAGFS